MFVGCYFLSRLAEDNQKIEKEITTSKELENSPQQRNDPLIFEQLIFESSKLDRIIKERFGGVDDSQKHMDNEKKLETDPVYNDLLNSCKNTYKEFEPIVKNIAEYCMADGMKNSWPGEHEAMRLIKMDYAKRENKKYIELRVWEIKNENPENNQTHTYVEMRSDGLENGRIVQMKDNKKDGYYIDFYNQKPIIIRKLVNGKKLGLELSFYNDSDALQTYANYVEGGVMGPAFYWDEKGNIITFEYFSQPTRRMTVWPPDIRLKSN